MLQMLSDVLCFRNPVERHNKHMILIHKTSWSRQCVHALTQMGNSYQLFCYVVSSGVVVV
jgi:hypothetical protein